MDKLLKLNIQMFAEEADNANLDQTNDTDNDVNEVEVDTNLDTENADGEESNSNENTEKVNTEEDNSNLETKKYSERLNSDRKKIELEVKESYEKEQITKLDAIAKTRGYSGWKEMEDAVDEQKLDELGIVDKDDFKKYLDGAISKNEDIIKAKEIIANQSKLDQDKLIGDQISKINKLNSKINTIDDLAKVDKYDELIDKVKKGYDMVDAYQILYYNQIQSDNNKSAQINAINNVNSKSHLKTTNGGSSNSVIKVPDDIMATYRHNSPNMTDKEIKSHYGKYLRGE